MKISFTAKTNKDYCMVNTAVFITPTKTLLTVDRDRTDWSVVGEKLKMEWNGCYLWEIDGHNFTDFPAYLNEDAAKGLFHEAQLLTLELEDDADPDYIVEDIRFTIS